MTRPAILTFAGHYLPGYKAGGPIRSIANMVEQLGDEFDFRIVAADRDLGDAAPFPDVAVNTWNIVGGARVFYRSPGATGWRALLKSLEQGSFDLIYLNSFFSTGAALRPLVYRAVARLARKPVLLAPRGEFSPGALALKPTKKRAFIALARATGLYRNVVFQASSEHEAADIRRTLGDVPVHVASDLPGRSAPDADRLDVAAPGQPLRAVFLSRISPMKNLLGAIEMLARVRAPITFDIYGVIEDGAYWARCQAAIAALPPHVQARYQRPLRPDEVIEVLARHDFFFLPTLGENYGHVIREALSAGLPVLISDRTPWRGLVAESAGADLPLEAPDAFVAWVEQFAALAPAERAAMRRAARTRGDDPAAAAAAVNANRTLLLRALGAAA
ncbi:glycosyltransferase family 4 protein [Brevundimonas sp. KM4]|uniref:glycosyltransferase family 4 protein n=1 Tax=Brevundimonas sp. KM4 TaxID=1628191 RepID=UPI0006971E1F|nr:glycosyltransferase family 4 protein [Brevundimonas sp. KM4]